MYFYLDLDLYLNNTISLQVVYAKTAETKKDAELERQICETYMVLGEISLENENYPQAVEDLTICLKKQTDDLPSDSRCDIHLSTKI